MTEASPLRVDRIVLAEDVIKARVAELGLRIAEDFEGEDLRLVTVLKGGLFFLSDLCRCVDLPLSIDFLAVTQYEPGQGGVVRVTKDLSDDINGASVILVEDVVDTGLTVNYVLSMLRQRSPKRLEVCAFLDKPVRRIAEVPITYRGFEMSDDFLVGYGLDLNGLYRNMRCVVALDDDQVAL